MGNETTWHVLIQQTYPEATHALEHQNSHD